MITLGPEYPLTVLIIGEPKVLRPAFQIDGDGGQLYPWRTDTLVQVYTDLGFRTVKLEHIIMR